MSTSKLKPRSRPDLERLEDLASDFLTRPQALTPQVLQYLLTNHDVEQSAVPTWLRETLPTLESYELDLLLSPLFTPSFETRVEFERALKESWLDAGDVEQLLLRMASRKLSLTLLQDGETAAAPLPDVITERFLRLLHLDVPLPLDAAPGLRSLDDAGRTYLRDRTWHRPQSRSLLPILLDAVDRLVEPAEDCETDCGDYVHFLTDFVRSHRPSSRGECVRYLASVAEAYEEDLRKHESGSRPFFSEELKANHSGKWPVGEGVVANHKRMISMARALEKMLS